MIRSVFHARQSECHGARAFGRPGQFAGYQTRPEASIDLVLCRARESLPPEYVVAVRLRGLVQI